MDINLVKESIIKKVTLHKHDNSNALFYCIAENEFGGISMSARF